MKKVYGYIRVSTVKQGDGVSLIAQKEAITNYAAKYNLEIIQWFEELETAAKQGRPLFTTMMKLLQKKKADGVIIHKIDRGARNLKDWADLGNLIDQGVEIHFAHESLDLQARGGRLSADIQAVIAADYIRNLRQEAIKGIYGRLQQGIYPFQAPYGYLNMGGGKVKIIDTVQGPLVKKAFQLYATKKYTLDTLSEKMYELGLRNTTQGKVKVNSLSVMLNNQFYMGIIRVKDRVFNGMHEPLVSPSLFKQVQAILNGNTNQKIKKHSFKYSRLITCDHCKHFLTPEFQRGHIYYRCHTKACTTKGLNENSIENFLLRKFTAVQLFPMEYEELDSQLKEAEHNLTTRQEELLNTTKLQVANAQQRLERLTDCYVDGGLDRETFEVRKLKLLQELKSKEATEKQLLTNNDSILKRTRKYFEQAITLIDSYKKANPEEKRKLVEKVSSNIAVDGKNLMIAMKSPFWELANRSDLSKCPLDRESSRIVTEEFVADGINTPLAHAKPLSKDQLKQLLDLILDQVAKLPEANTELDYDI